MTEVSAQRYFNEIRHVKVLCKLMSAGRRQQQPASICNTLAKSHGLPSSIHVVKNATDCVLTSPLSSSRAARSMALPSFNFSAFSAGLWYGSRTCGLLFFFLLLLLPPKSHPVLPISSYVWPVPGGYTVVELEIFARSSLICLRTSGSACFHGNKCKCR